MKKNYFLLCLIAFFLLIRHNSFSTVVVTNPPSSISVNKNANAQTVDLGNVFTSDIPGLITIDLDGNSNSDLVSASIIGSLLILDFTQNLTGSAVITFTGSDRNTSASSSIFVEVKEVNYPVSFSSSATGLDASFSDRTEGNPNNWTWDFGDGSSSELQNPNHKYNSGGVYTVCLSIMDALGNKQQTCKDITVADNSCTAGFTYTQVELLRNSVSFTDISIGVITNYDWDFGDGSTSSASSPNHTYISSGSYNICLTVSNPLTQCYDYYCETIQVGGLPNLFTADFAYTISPSANFVTFEDKSSLSANDWYWDFSDGTTSTLQNPTHTFPGSGIYNVCLSVKNSLGNVESVCYEVVIGDSGCEAIFSYGQSDLINTISFKDASLGNLTGWSWDFGDGSGSSMQNPIHNYKTSGNYDVCLTVINDVTNCVKSYCENIQVGSVIDRFFADFSYIIDPATEQVSFNDKSSPSVSDWYWDFGDGNFSTEKNPIYKYSKSGEYQVCMYVNDATYSKFESKCSSILVNSSNSTVLNADFDFYINQITNDLKIDNKSTGKYTQIFWDFGDGNNSYEENPSHTYLEPNNYIVCLTLYDEPTGSFSDICKEVTIEGEINGPNADFIAVIDPLTNEVRFRDKSIGNITDWFWDFSDGFTSTEQNPTHKYESSNDYYVCLYLYDSKSDRYSEQCKDVIVSRANEEVLNSKFSYFPNTISNEVIFNDFSRGAIAKWYWDFGDGEFSTEQNPIHKYNLSGAYNVCLSVADLTDNLQSTQCEIVQLSQYELIADFISFVDPVTQNVSFTDMSKGDIDNWFWNFGDGQTSNLQNPDYKYEDAGTYFVCLTIINSKTGYFADYCKEINIRKSGDTQIFKADFFYFVDPSTNMVNFENNSTGDITGYYWTLGDGNYREDKNISYKYESSGVYYVCLNILNEKNGNYDQVCKEVNVANTVCKIGSKFTYFIDNVLNKTVFSNASWGKITEVFWTFGDGDVASGLDAVTHIYKEPGVYEVTLSVMDGTGLCTDVSVQNVIVGNLECKAGFTYSIVPKDKKVIFDNRSKGKSLSYYWYFGDGESSSLETPTHIYESPGSYYVSLTISNANGTCYDYYEEEIQVGQIECGAKFTYFIDSKTKVGQFESQVIGDVSNYYWQFGDGGVSVDKNPTHNYTSTGYFTISLSTYDDKTGCMAYFENTVLVGEQGKDCEADFLFQVNGKSVKFFDNSSGKIVTYIWDFNNGINSNKKDTSIIYDKADFYNVCLSVIDVNGVQNTTCRLVEVRDVNSANCRADFISTTNIITKKVAFVDKSLGQPTSWRWEFGDGSTSTEPNPTHTYTKADYYTVKLTISNSVTGCNSVDIQVVNVSNNTNLYADFEYFAKNNNLKSGGYPTDFMSSSFGTPAKAVWDFGDGAKDSTSTTPSHSYTSPGNYQVCLTVSDPNTGIKSASQCHTIKIGEPIVVSGSIKDITVDEDAVPTVIDISKVFSGNSNIMISVVGNTNSDLVKASINDNKLTLIYTGEKSGIAKISLEAKTNDQKLTNDFQIEVKALDDPPYIKNDIPDVTVKENANDATIDLSAVFDDIDTDKSLIIKTIQSNTNLNLLSATIDGNNLKIKFLTNQFGQSVITIRATSNEKTVDASFKVTVTEVVGIASLDILKELVVFPNPNKGDFAIIVSTKIFSDLLIEIINSQGHIAYKGTIKNVMKFNKTFDFKQFCSGIYAIRITSGNQTVVKKFVIQH